MSSANLEKVIEEVKALAPDEQRKVKDLIESLLRDSGKSADSNAQTTKPAPEELFEQKLLEAGIISEIPKRLPTPESLRDFKPVAVKGKPVSETIIEERR
jgi:hypothetical protein